jgi:predicted secreted protein
MRDLSHKHILAFAIFFIALFAVLFVGVIEVHSRNMQRHATASNAPHTQIAPTN